MKAGLDSTFKKVDVKEDYIIGKVIGKGSFSIVSECTHKVTGEICAVKAMSKSKFLDSKQIENEIEILKVSSHQNIIKLIDVYETSDFLYLVMELIRGGELYAEVIDIGPFNEMKAYKIFVQLFEAVQYLHSKNITHRDLKLENILINENLQLKLSDFGLSKKLDPSNIEFMKTRCGTPSYVAPEILLGELYTPSVDLWSLGVILYLMVFCQYPFQANNIYQMYELIISGNIDFPTNVSKDLQDLIRGLMTVDVKDRLTLEGVANHPWMLKYLISTNQAISLIQSLSLSCSAEILTSQTQGESQPQTNILTV